MNKHVYLSRSQMLTLALSFFAPLIFPPYSTKSHKYYHTLYTFFVYIVCWWLFLYQQVGIVNVALCEPSGVGSYTSHWRLAHAGEQFGPRVWCSIVVDPLAPAPMMADGILVSPCVTPQVRQIACKNRNTVMEIWCHKWIYVNKMYKN